MKDYVIQLQFIQEQTIFEIVIQRQTGLLVEEKDPQAIVDSIITYIQEPQLQRHCIEEARRLVEREYDIKKIAAQKKKIFEEIHCQKTNRKLPKNELKVLWRAEKAFRAKLSKDIKYVPKVYLSKAVEKLQVEEVSLQAKLPSLKEQ